MQHQTNEDAELVSQSYTYSDTDEDITFVCGHWDLEI